MGSFVGHVDEATVFLILAVWWMYKSFTSHIKASFGKGHYQIQTSYFCYIRGRRLPLEQTLKILFPFVGFLAELIDGKFSFHDSNGNLAGINHLQHMTIYGIFIMHGVIDLLQRLEMPFIAPNMDFLSAGVAFFWYALSFYYHANMPGKKPLEVIIHVIPTYAIYMVALMCILAIYNPRSFAVDFLRCFGLLTLGTWFMHTSFIMYIPGFPGKEDNPNWDRSNYKNVHFIIANFGFHLIANFIFTTVFYVVCYFVVTRGMNHRGVKYTCVGVDEELALIDNEEHQGEPHTQELSSKS